MGKLTDLEVVDLHDGYGESLNQIARERNYARSTIQRKYKRGKRIAAHVATIRRADEVFARTQEEPVDAVTAMQSKLKSQSQAQATVKTIKAAAKERNFREFLSDEFRGLIPQSTVTPPPAMTDVPSGPNGTSVESALFQWSDWHLDEIVLKESVLGLNEFNLSVALKRVHDVLRRSLNIITRMERGGGWYFRKAVISINGDMITGAIHGLEKHTVTGNVVMNSWLCAQVLRDAILVVARRFPTVEVYFSPGNHTRFENEKSYNDPLRTWDTVIAMMVQEGLAAQENVTVHIPNSYLAEFELEGWNFLQTHGEELASQFGVGIERLQSRLTHLRDIHYFLLGHWHQAADYPALQGSVFYNGSLIGANAYSLGKIGKATPPSQNLLFVKGSKGVTAPWAIKPDIFPGPEALSFGPYTWS